MPDFSVPPTLFALDWETNPAYPWFGLIADNPRYFYRNSYNVYIYCLGMFPLAENQWVVAYQIPVAYYQSTLDGWLPSDYYLAWRIVTAASDGTLTFGPAMWNHVTATAPSPPNSDLPWQLWVDATGNIVLYSTAVTDNSSPLTLSLVSASIDWNTGNFAGWGTVYTPNFSSYTAGAFPNGSFMQVAIASATHAAVFIGYNGPNSGSPLTHQWFFNVKFGGTNSFTALDLGQYFNNGVTHSYAQFQWFNSGGFILLFSSSSGNSAYGMALSQPNPTVLSDPVSIGYPSSWFTTGTGGAAYSGPDSQTGTGLTIGIVNANAFTVSTSGAVAAGTAVQIIPNPEGVFNSGQGAVEHPAPYSYPLGAGVGSLLSQQLDGSGNPTKLVERQFGHDPSNALNVVIKSTSTWPIGTLAGYTWEIGQPDTAGNFLYGMGSSADIGYYAKYLWSSVGVRAPGGRWFIGGLALPS